MIIFFEANRDPIVNFLGERFAYVEGPDNALLRFTEELVSLEKEGNILQMSLLSLP